MASEKLIECLLKEACEKISEASKEAAAHNFPAWSRHFDRIAIDLSLECGRFESAPDEDPTKISTALWDLSGKIAVISERLSARRLPYLAHQLDGFNNAITLMAITIDTVEGMKG